MKQITIYTSIFVAFLLSTNIKAQTPYDQYTKPTKIKHMLELEEKHFFRAYNSDTTSIVSYIEFNEVENLLYAYSKTGDIIEKQEIHPQTVKWLSIDPLARKYPSESPYNFVSNNPIICIDPDGREKIVVIGGIDKAGKDQWKFVNSGMGALFGMSHTARINESNEQITVVLCNAYMTSAEISQVREYAMGINLNVNFQVVDNSKQITNYLNSKNISTLSLSKERSTDQVTRVDMFGHGYAEKSSSINPLGSFEPGHNPNIETDLTGPNHTNWRWDGNAVAQLAPDAFNNPTWNMNSCNSSTSGLSQQVSKQTNGTATGFVGKSDYISIYGGVNFMGYMLGDNRTGNIQTANPPSTGNQNNSSSSSYRETSKNGVIQKQK